MKITKRQRKTLELQVENNGFTLWAHGGKKHGRYWLIDASTIFQDGNVCISDNPIEERKIKIEGKKGNYWITFGKGKKTT